MKKNKLVKSCANCIYLEKCGTCSYQKGTDACCFNNYENWSPKPCDCKQPDCILCEEYEKVKILAHAKINAEFREALTPILEQKAHEYAIHEGFIIRSDTSLEDVMIYKKIKKAYIAGAMLMARNLSI